MRKEMSVKLLESNVEAISRNIHSYWTNHVGEIKQALSAKQSRAKPAKKNLSTKDAMSK